MNCLELVLETSIKLQFLMKSSYYLTKFHGFIVFAPTLVYILIHIHIWNFLVYICIHFGSEVFFGFPHIWVDFGCIQLNGPCWGQNREFAWTHAILKTLGIVWWQISFFSY